MQVHHNVQSTKCERKKKKLMSPFTDQLVHQFLYTKSGAQVGQ